MRARQIWAAKNRWFEKRGPALGKQIRKVLKSCRRQGRGLSDPQQRFVVFPTRSCYFPGMNITTIQTGWAAVIALFRLLSTLVLFRYYEGKWKALRIIQAE